jgi:enoyl-CoA hydratase/carnithine racemase
MSKRLLNQSFESPLALSLQLEAVSQALASTTEDVREGLTAITEKRDPKFQGR